MLILGFPDRRDDLGVGRQLAGGERDEDSGIVAVGRNDDRLGVLGAGQPQHFGVRPAAADGDQSGALGALKLSVKAEGGHYTFVQVDTDQMGESRMDRNVKKYFVGLHKSDDPAYELTSSY